MDERLLDKLSEPMEPIMTGLKIEGLAELTQQIAELTLTLQRILEEDKKYNLAEQERNQTYYTDRDGTLRVKQTLYKTSGGSS